MNLLGVHATLMLGPTIAMPAPAPLVEALERIEVEQASGSPSSFALTFRAGRSGPLDLLDSPVTAHPLLRRDVRVVVTVMVNATPSVLSDGFIEAVDHRPSAEPGRSTVTVYGQDVSTRMGLTQRSAEHPAQSDVIIAAKIIATYAAELGLVPATVPPLSLDQPIPIERTPVQTTDDLSFLKELARRNDHVFYVIPGPLPNMNVGYWGPPIRVGVPQPAITMNMGSFDNASGVTISQQGAAVRLVDALVQDRATNEVMPVQTMAPTRVPLAAEPGYATERGQTRTERMPTSGLTMAQAMARAQAITNASIDMVTLQGELDTVRYNRVLEARALVGVRGIGQTNDGFYYVDAVSHTIARGEHTQRFTLKREGRGAISPMVIP